MSRRALGKLALVLGGVLVALLLCEVTLRGLGFRWAGAHSLAVEEFVDAQLPWSKQIVFEDALYEPHDVLGYITRPGTHRISIRLSNAVRRQQWDYTVVNGDDGYRTTSSTPEQFAGRPVVAVFGCSLTWGTPHDNDKTFPWLLQLRMPEYDVRNYAVGGYGNVHALLQLRTLIGEGRTPAAAVFMYSDIHLARNVAAASRLNAFRFHKSSRNFMDGTFRHPQAVLDDAGNLEIRLVPIEQSRQPDPDVDSMVRTTNRIFDDIYRLCVDHGIVPVVADQTANPSSTAGKDAGAVIRHCRETGFHVIDARADLTDADRCLPFDNHPNATVHQFWAERVYDGLAGISSAQARDSTAVP